MNRLFVGWGRLLGITLCAVVLGGVQLLVVEQYTRLANDAPCTAVGLGTHELSVVAVIDCHDAKAVYSLDRGVIVARGNAKQALPVFCDRYKYKSQVSCALVKNDR